MKKTKRSLSVILLGFLSAFLIQSAWAQAPAFPGAEGHGRYVTGGRGGKVVHVTNLNDAGTGSFRAAVSGNSKKIVVFDVGGVIALASDLKIGQNTTILLIPESRCAITRFGLLPTTLSVSFAFVAGRKRMSMTGQMPFGTATSRGLSSTIVR